MYADQRSPVFELHIQPMFRLLDREHMLEVFGPSVDLWELERVWELRNDILLRLRAEADRNMPGIGVGGPWPREWIDLFERWTQNPTADDIGHHLLRALPAGLYELEPLSEDRWRLRATVVAPSLGCRAWFGLDAVTADRREYTLCLEPALPAQASAETTLYAVETFVRGDVRKLVVRDVAGVHELPVI